ncbi:MAG: hypothetical protein L3K26_06345 [Candidatus Hydrogenedentes bacterium]|nr:hypothetical protein [Candidatus Hydrogenedentota bacterium]
MVSIANLHPQYITDENGERTSVVLPLPEFLALVEDIGDLAIVAERREEPTISHEALLKELRRDGLV